MNTPQVRYRISSTEFARQAGLSKMSIHNRSKKDANFPKPVYIGRNKLWYQDEIDAWFKEVESDTSLGCYVNLKRKA
ncbi:MAG: AlpA family phage regulatory protein [Methylococcaceae bacterium]